MVQFVNIREFKTKTDAVLRRLDRNDVILTIRGKPKAMLRRISEGDLSLKEGYTSRELDRLEILSREPGVICKTAAEAKRHLRRLVR